MPAAEQALPAPGFSWLIGKGREGSAVAAAERFDVQRKILAVCFIFLHRLSFLALVGSPGRASCIFPIWGLLREATSI